MKFKITSAEKRMILKRRKTTSETFPMLGPKCRAVIDNIASAIEQMNEVEMLVKKMEMRGLAPNGVKSKIIFQIKDKIENLGAAFEDLYVKNIK